VLASLTAAKTSFNDDETTLAGGLALGVGLQRTAKTPAILGPADET
jgi:hypothetical protein